MGSVNAVRMIQNKLFSTKLLSEMRYILFLNHVAFTTGKKSYCFTIF